MITFCFVLIAVFASTSAQWRQLQLPGRTVKDVSSKGDYLWIIGDDNQVYTVDPNNLRLTRIPGPNNVKAVSIGATPDGSAWVITGNGLANGPIYRISNNDVWELMPGALFQINAISKDSAIGITKDGDIYLYQYIASTKTYNWVKFNSGKAKWAAVGENNEFWVIGTDNKVYRWNQSSWVSMPGGCLSIDVLNSNERICVGTDGRPYGWENGNWKQLEGTATKVSLNANNYFKVDKNMLFIES